jgi:hypothetical protein
MTAASKLFYLADLLLRLSVRRLSEKMGFGDMVASFSILPIVNAITVRISVRA